MFIILIQPAHPECEPCERIEGSGYLIYLKKKFHSMLLQLNFASRILRYMPQGGTLPAFAQGFGGHGRKSGDDLTYIDE